MDTFDTIFAVLRDDDGEKLRELGISPKGPALSDSEVEALVAERQAARKRRDFAASDRIRDELAERGVILEDSRDGGVRWKRK
jgi:cysteinyl-tRNA synthetase